MESPIKWRIVDHSMVEDASEDLPFVSVADAGQLGSILRTGMKDARVFTLAHGDFLDVFIGVSKEFGWMNIQDLSKKIGVNVLPSVRTATEPLRICGDLGDGIPPEALLHVEDLLRIVRH